MFECSFDLGTPFNQEAARRFFNRIEEALDRECVRKLSLFLQECDSKHYGLTFRVDPTEEKDVSPESSLGQSLVQEYDIWVSAIVNIHLWSLVEEICHVLVLILFELNGERVFFTLLLESFLQLTYLQEERLKVQLDHPLLYLSFDSIVFFILFIPAETILVAPSTDQEIIFTLDRTEVSHTSTVT